MKKILVVDDHQEILSLLTLVLRKEGRKLLQAFNAEEALVIAQVERPDLVLLDVMMPGGMDGLELARLLKKDPETTSCAIVIMTAKEGEAAMNMAFDVGAADFIRKPFDMPSMLKKVEKLLEVPDSLPAGR